MTEPHSEVPTTSVFHPRTFATLFGVAMALFMSALENTVVGTAMPTVIANLGGIEIYSWVFAAYILSATVMTPVWGKISDLFGRRPALFGGLSLFILGSALSGAAHSMPQLIAFRVIQGLGAAAIFPVGITIIADLLTLEQRAKTIPLFSGMWGLASLVGPLVGGIVTERFSWRWCFYLILPFGLLAGGLIAFSYREKYGRRPQVTLDYGGMLTLSAALVLLLLLVERGAEYSWPQQLLALTGCAAFFVWFIQIERRHPEPLIPLSLLQNRMVAIVSLHGIAAMMVLIGAMSFLPLFVQGVIGTNAEEAGKILIALIIPWVCASIIGGRLILRFGYRPLVLLGMASMLLGTGLLTQVTTHTTRLGLSLNVAFIGMGGGMTIATLMLAAQHAIPRTMLGLTTSTVQFARSIGAALGAGIIGALMNWKLKRLMTQAPLEVAQITGHGDIAAIVRPETRQALSPMASMFLQESLAGALRVGFYFVFGVAVVAAIIALFVPAGRAHDLMHREESDAEVSETLANEMV